jgi:hypothetical protein
MTPSRSGAVGLTLPAIAVAAALSACSSGSARPSAGGPSTGSPLASTHSAATVHQFVSVVAAFTDKVTKEQDALRSCPAKVEADRIVCGVFANHASFDSTDAASQITKLGPSPQQIAVLVQQTVQALGKVSDALPTAPVEYCNQNASARCDRFENLQRGNVDQLVTVLAGWHQYE